MSRRDCGKSPARPEQFAGEGLPFVARALAQFEHRASNCSRKVLTDAGNSLDVQYSCGGSGFRSQPAKGDHATFAADRDPGDLRRAAVPLRASGTAAGRLSAKKRLLSRVIKPSFNQLALDQASCPIWHAFLPIGLRSPIPGPPFASRAALLLLNILPCIAGEGTARSAVEGPFPQLRWPLRRHRGDMAANALPADQGGAIGRHCRRGFRDRTALPGLGRPRCLAAIDVAAGDDLALAGQRRRRECGGALDRARSGSCFPHCRCSWFFRSCSARASASGPVWRLSLPGRWSSMPSCSGRRRSSV